MWKSISFLSLTTFKLDVVDDHIDDDYDDDDNDDNDDQSSILSL